MRATLDLPPGFDPMTGRFGRFGGRFVAETLMPALDELTRAFFEAWADPTSMIGSLLALDQSSTGPWSA